jgi:hypothetical protein
MRVAGSQIETGISLVIPPELNLVTGKTYQGRDG